MRMTFTTLSQQPLIFIPSTSCICTEVQQVGAWKGCTFTTHTTHILYILNAAGDLVIICEGYSQIFAALFGRKALACLYRALTATCSIELHGTRKKKTVTVSPCHWVPESIWYTHLLTHTHVYIYIHTYLFDWLFINVFNIFPYVNGLV